MELGQELKLAMTRQKTSSDLSLGLNSTTHLVFFYIPTIHVRYLGAFPVEQKAKNKNPRAIL